MTDWTAPKDTALIVVDVQNDFCPGGTLAVPGGDEIIPAVNRLKDKFDTVIVTQDYHPADHQSFASQHAGKAPLETVEMFYGQQVLWPDHCVQGTDGADFHPDLNLKDSDLVLRKGTNSKIDSYSGFYENDRKTRPRLETGKTLTETLQDRGIKKLVFCGLAYDFCVGWHALDALKDSFDAVVVKDATRAIKAPHDSAPDTEAAMTAALDDAGATIVTESRLPEALGQRPSDNDKEFKAG